MGHADQVSLELPEDPPWSGWDVLLMALVTLFCMAVFSLGAFAIGMHLPAFQGAQLQDLARDPRIVLPVQAAAYAVVILFMYLLVRLMYHRRFWATVKWTWPELGRGGMFVLGGMGLAIAVQLASAFLPIPKSMPIERMFKTPVGAYLMGAFGISMAPLMEELFFRGFLYPVLARRMGMWPGIVVTAAAFAALHQSQLGYAWAPLLLLFVVGTVLTYTRARTGSVACSFLIHMGYNLLLFAVLWHFSEHFRNFQKAM